MKELKDNLTKIAVHFYVSHGLPLDVFNDRIGKLSLLDQYLLTKVYDTHR